MLKSGLSIVLATSLLAMAAGQAAAQSHPTPSSLDITGVWIGMRQDPNAPYKNSPMKDPPLTPEGERMSKYWADPTHNLGARCLPAGGPAGLMQGSDFFPIETIQKDGQVTILYEMMELTRRVFTDGRDHPKDLDPSWVGNSIGHWEGDTLVVDTIGMHAGPINGSGNTVVALKGDKDVRWPISEKGHLTERIRMLEGGKFLEDIETVDDPTIYSRPIEMKRYWRRAPEITPMEMICNENLRPNDDGSGHQGKGDTDPK